MRTIRREGSLGAAQSLALNENKENRSIRKTGKNKNVGERAATDHRQS